MDNDELVCPIFAAASLSKGNFGDDEAYEYCLGEDCAWWVEAQTPIGEGMCAIRFYAIVSGG
jgi:hypothetical protein